MIDFDNATKENIEEHNPNWLQIPDHPCRILIIGESRFGKTNSLFNVISQEPDIDKIYLFFIFIFIIYYLDLKIHMEQNINF